MSLNENVINFKTGKPIRSFKKLRGKKVEVPELLVKEDVQSCIDFLMSNAQDLDELIIFGRKFDGSYIESTNVTSETKAMAASFINKSIDFEHSY